MLTDSFLLSLCVLRTSGRCCCAFQSRHGKCCLQYSASFTKVRRSTAQAEVPERRVLGSEEGSRNPPIIKISTHLFFFTQKCSVVVRGYEIVLKEGRRGGVREEKLLVWLKRQNRTIHKTGLPRSLPRALMKIPTKQPSRFPLKALSSARGSTSTPNYLSALPNDARWIHAASPTGPSG